MTTLSTDPVYFLLVDDLEENLLALEALLRREGLVALKARSGPEALELLLKHEVALALIDIQMPTMDGFELAELMRGMERTRRVPIIFLTAGNADRQRRFRGYEAGAVDFLHKPLEPDILRGKADVFFELFRQRQEVALQRDELKAAIQENSRLLRESRQYAEALQEADQRKDDFLAMLAHELRNPLAPVRNAVEILRLSDSTDPMIAQAREIVSRQISHMTRLVDDLLDVARIARGKVQLRLESCDLAAVVRQTAEDYRPTLNAAGISLEVRVPDASIPVMGDPVRLAQIIGNLLHNARKFTFKGGKVEVQTMVDPESQTAEVTVQDNGTGFDNAVLPRLFQPFSQADQTLDREKGGLGLGLALVKGLVDLHSGTVSGSSAGPGEGATFSFRLPVTVNEQQAAPGAGGDASDSTVRTLRILIIEDNQDSAKSLQLLLSLWRHNVTIAHDGVQGLATAHSFQPDVIISDLGLPGQMDGFGVASAIRLDASLADVYLIAISGYGQDDDRRRAQESGFNHHLIKPVELTTLEKILHTVPRRTVSGK